jgi:nanoRNase/pAp phosphatase (c-di-AMP/oligoRNAs hydrolase)
MAAIVLKLHPDSVVDKYFNGKFDRPQNKTMRELLQLKHRPAAEFGERTNPPYTAIFSVDGPRSVCVAQPHIIIDHHPEDGDPIQGQDVRPIGSCSAIMWEYAMEAGIDFDSEEGAKLATALAIGIATDTKEKTTESTSVLDWEADAFCGRHRDAALYDGIKNYPKPHYYMDMLLYGWDRKVIEGTCLVTELGVIPEERTGVISDIAEKLAEMAGISTSVVVAWVDGAFVASVRSTDPSFGINEFCKTLGNGGGRRGAGKFVINFPTIYSNLTDLELLEGHFRSGYNIISHKILKYTGDGIRSRPKNETV